MGLMKDFDIRIRNGGDDAAGAVNELMAELQRRLLELQDSMPRWIPVVERLPGGREEVLGWQTWVPNEGWGEGVFVCHRGTKFGEWYSEDGQLPNITHWMPLPAPPTSDR